MQSRETLPNFPLGLLVGAPLLPAIVLAGGKLVPLFGVQVHIHSFAGFLVLLLLVGALIAMLLIELIVIPIAVTVLARHSAERTGVNIGVMSLASAPVLPAACGSSCRLPWPVEQLPLRRAVA